MAKSMDRLKGARRRDDQRTRRHLMVCGTALYLIAGCASDDAPADLVAPRTTRQSLSKDVDPGDFPAEGRSPQAIVVRWSESDDEARHSQLEATVANTTDAELSTEIMIRMMSPTGQLIERPLPRRTLAQKETAQLVLGARDLPIQSAGMASSVQIIAQYDPGPNSVAGTELTPEASTTVSSYSPLRYITHDADFAMMTIRTSAKEADVNGADYLVGKRPELGELRGAVTKGEPSHIQFVLTLPADDADSPRQLEESE